VCRREGDEGELTNGRRAEVERVWVDDGQPAGAIPAVQIRRTAISRRARDKDGRGVVVVDDDGGRRSGKRLAALDGGPRAVAVGVASDGSRPAFDRQRSRDKQKIGLIAAAKGDALDGAGETVAERRPLVGCGRPRANRRAADGAGRGKGTGDDDVRRRRTRQERRDGGRAVSCCRRVQKRRSSATRSTGLEH